MNGWDNLAEQVLEIYITFIMEAVLCGLQFDPETGQNALWVDVCGPVVMGQEGDHGSPVYCEH